MYDAIIVGAGPAGLSAALVLGRCRRRVLLCDSGTPRNAVSRGVNGFLTRDGVAPAELRRIGREQLAPYGVEVRDIEVVDASRSKGGFEVELSDGGRERARKLVLAPGLIEELPDIEGIEACWGRSVFNCPYCDGWEERDQPIAVYGRGESGKNFAVQLTVWTRDLVLCTDGPGELSRGDLDHLARAGIGLREEPVERLEAVDGKLQRIHFEHGDPLSRRALFFITGDSHLPALATRMRVALNDKGTVDTSANEKTEVPGLYVAGDASRRVHFAIVAAGEGAMAGFAVNCELLAEDMA